MYNVHVRLDLTQHFFWQTKQYNVALFIYQALQLIAGIKPSTGQRTVQQVQALMERLETAVKKVVESLRSTVGVGM